MSDLESKSSLAAVEFFAAGRADTPEMRLVHRKRGERLMEESHREQSLKENEEPAEAL